MVRTKAVLGFGLALCAFGCGSKSSGPDAGGAGGGAGTGGSASTMPPSGAAGSAPTSVGGAGDEGDMGGAGGATTGAAGAGGETTGMAGAGGGTTCTGDPLTRCAGTMSGAWCSETLPSSGTALIDYRGIWSDAPDDAWVVGGMVPPGGTTVNEAIAAHFDGCSWTVMPRADLPSFAGVWGAAPDDVWIVGGGGDAFHWNGSALVPVPVPGATGLAAVNGTSSSDVWAAGNAVFHWDGSAWSKVTDVQGRDIWEVAPDNVWIANGVTDAIHFDGTTWTTTTLTDFGLFTIWADATQAYAGGEGESMFRFANGAWTTLAVRGGSSEGFVDMGGLGNDVFAVGNSDLVRLSGTTLTRVTDVPTGTYRAIWVSPTQIWLAVPDGVVAHRAR